MFFTDTESWRWTCCPGVFQTSGLVLVKIFSLCSLALIKLVLARVPHGKTRGEGGRTVTFLLISCCEVTKKM